MANTNPQTIPFSPLLTGARHPMFAPGTNTNTATATNVTSSMVDDSAFPSLVGSMSLAPLPPPAVAPGSVAGVARDGDGDSSERSYPNSNIPPPSKSKSIWFSKQTRSLVKTLHRKPSAPGDLPLSLLPSTPLPHTHVIRNIPTTPTAQQHNRTKASSPAVCDTAPPQPPNVKVALVTTSRAQTPSTPPEEKGGTGGVEPRWLTWSLI
jgi:hypothetical protein